MPVLSTEKLLNRIWKMKSEPLSHFLSFHLFVSRFSEQEKQQDRIAPSTECQQSSYTAHTHAHTSTRTHTHARQESVCGGLVGVNLHVNEMALSALVSNSKRVRAKDAIFGVCIVHVFMCPYMCMCSA